MQVCHLNGFRKMKSRINMLGFLFARFLNLALQGCLFSLRLKSLPLFIGGPYGRLAVMLHTLFSLNINQRTNGPVNVHLISGSSVSTKHTKPD